MDVGDRGVSMVLIYSPDGSNVYSQIGVSQWAFMRMRKEKQEAVSLP